MRTYSRTRRIDKPIVTRVGSLAVWFDGKNIKLAVLPSYSLELNGRRG